MFSFAFVPYPCARTYLQTQIGTWPGIPDTVWFLAAPNQKLPSLLRIRTCGIVAEFSAIVPTRNGGVMSSFQLRDMKGRCIQCMAVGRHAGSVLLQKGNEVVIFFAHATKSLSASRNGHLSVYDECHIALLRSKVPVPRARQEMQIRD